MTNSPDAVSLPKHFLFPINLLSPSLPKLRLPRPSSPNRAHDGCPGRCESASQPRVRLPCVSSPGILGGRTNRCPGRRESASQPRVRLPWVSSPGVRGGRTNRCPGRRESASQPRVRLPCVSSPGVRGGRTNRCPGRSEAPRASPGYASPVSPRPESAEGERPGDRPTRPITSDKLTPIEKQTRHRGSNAPSQPLNHAPILIDPPSSSLPVSIFK